MIFDVFNIDKNSFVQIIKERRTVFHPADEKLWINKYINK